jgi:hypothetical protein
MLGALFGLVVLVADVWAIDQVATSREARGTKALWAVLILLPVLGLIVWYFAGPRGEGS